MLFLTNNKKLTEEKDRIAYARPIAFQKKRKAFFKCFEQYNCMMCCCWLANNSTWISSRDTCRAASQFSKK